MKKVVVSLFLFLIVFLLTGCSNGGMTGSFNEVKLSNLRIKTATLGHPSGEYIHEVFTELFFKKYNNHFYHADYQIGYSIESKSAKEDFPNIDNYDKVVINNKEYSYIINNENTIVLIYHPEGKRYYLKIDVKMTDVYNIFMGETNDDVKITIDDLKRKRLSRDINFELE